MTPSNRPISWTDESVTRLWDYYASSPVHRRLYFSKVYGRSILKRSRLPLSKPLRVLDFGCGRGDLWAHISIVARRWSYTGLDFSAESVDELRSVAARATGFDGAVHVTELPSSLVNASFDAILLIEVVEHLSDEHLRGTIAEAFRLLKPSGRLVISTPHREDLREEEQLCPECGVKFHRWQHVRTWTRDSLKYAIEEHGLLHASTWVGHWGDQWWYGWLFNRAAKVLRGSRLDPHMLSTFVKPER